MLTRSLTRVRIGWRKYSVSGRRLFTSHRPAGVHGLNLNFPFVNDEDFAVFEYIIPLNAMRYYPRKKALIRRYPKIRNSIKMVRKQEI